MRSHRTQAAVVASAALGLIGFSPATPANASVGELEARLHGSGAYPNASGFSQFERENRGREIEVTVRHVAALTGKRLTVVVGGHRLGKVKVRPSGIAHREWESWEGKAVPSLAAGDRVRVRTADGTTVARGRYHVDD
jgi:hypothetical protein